MPLITWQRFIELARKRVSAMDELDKERGAPALKALELVQTCQLALEAGFNTGSWKCVGDAWVMLDQLVGKLSGGTDAAVRQ